MERLIDALPEPALLLDSTGGILFANQVAQSLLGVGETRLNDHELLSSLDIERLTTGASGGGELATAEVSLGRQTYAVRVTPIDDELLLLFMHDVTHLRQRDEMRYQFLTTVSHDLKNPLAMALGMAELLADEMEPDATTADYVQELLDALQKMQALVEGVLSLASAEAKLGNGGQGHSEPSKVIADVVQELRPQAVEKTQDLRIDVLPDLPAVSLGPVRLGQIVRNLIDNAIKYTPAQGHIIVHAKTQGGQVYIGVEDDGPGIPEAAQARLFQRFYRVGTPETEAEEGTGLGLSIVRAVAENCGGEAGFHSQPGQGSTFWVLLPTAEGAAQES
jgi:two-component system phosphate regulon sensor histidine kinase PhoR